LVFILSISVTFVFSQGGGASGSSIAKQRVAATATATADAVSGLFNWAYGRIKEKVTDQITLTPEEITLIIGEKEELAYLHACEQLTLGE
jgi:hypothetical protein